MTLVSLAIALIAALTSKPWVARRFPGLVAYYSFQPHPFSFAKTYSYGKAGPWTVGDSKEAALRNLTELHRPFRLPMDMSKEQLEELYYQENTHVTAHAAAVLIPSDSWRIATVQQGSSVVYDIRFSNNQLVAITISSTLMA